MPQANGTTAVATRPEPRVSLAQLTDIFATEATIRISLEGNHWIDVKRELNYGERTEIESASIRGMQREALTEASIAGNTFLLDLGRQRFLMLALYIVRWSFTDASTGNPIVLPGDLGERIAFMKGLHPVVGEALRVAVEEHHRKLREAEAEEEKVAQTQDPRLRARDDEVTPAPKLTENGAEPVPTPSPVSVS